MWRGVVDPIFAQSSLDTFIFNERPPRKNKKQATATGQQFHSCSLEGNWKGKKQTILTIVLS